MALETLNTPAPDDETPVRAPLATGTPVAAKGAYALPTSKSLVGVDPGLLENMQKMIAEREQQKNSFLESMKDATAWWSGGMAGPGEALARRAKEREEQEATTFGMKSQIAQYNAQQQSAQRKQASVLAAVGGGAPGTGGVGAGGMSTQVDPAIANQVRTMAQSDPAAAEKFLNDHLKKMAEITAAARLNKDSYAKVIEVRLADGRLDTVSLMELLNNPAKYQPTEAGAPIVEKLTGGVAPTTGATAPMGSAAKTATDLGVAIISGDRDFAKQSQLYAASQQPGYRGPPVAKPGFSKHETGNAIDVDPTKFTDADRQKLVAAGFKQTVKNDPNHWELVSTPATAAAPAAGAPAGLAPPTFQPLPPVQPLPKLSLPDRPDNFPVVAGEEKTAMPMAPAAAPAPVAPAAPVAPVAPRAAPVNVAQKTIPELRAEQKAAEEFQIAGAKGQAENIVKDEAAFRTTTEPKSVAERKTSAERVVTLVEQNPKAVGVIAKPGVINALATIARDGLNTPSGAIGIKTIEDALVLSMPGVDQKTVNARKEIAQNLARGALEASKLSQGQGSVSDFERSMFEKIAGSLADTPDLLIKRQKMLLARADLDQKTGGLYRSSKAPGRATDFETFTTSPAYTKAVNEYEEKLRSILGSDISIGKQGAAPAIPKYDADKEARYQKWKQSQGTK